MSNPNWMSEREQMLQNQLLQERQQFEAWRASQAHPKLSLNRSPLFHQGRQRGLRFRRILRLSQERSTSLKRPRPKDQATPKVSKHARSASTSRRSLSPRRVYPRGTSTATRPHQTTPKRAENRTVQTQDLEIF